MQIIIPKSAGYVCIHRPLIFFIFFKKIKRYCTQYRLRKYCTYAAKYSVRPLILIICIIILFSAAMTQYTVVYLQRLVAYLA